MWPEGRLWLENVLGEACHFRGCWRGLIYEGKAVLSIFCEIYFFGEFEGRGCLNRAKGWDTSFFRNRSPENQGRSYPRKFQGGGSAKFYVFVIKAYTVVVK